MSADLELSIALVIVGLIVGAAAWSIAAAWRADRAASRRRAASADAELHARVARMRSDLDRASSPLVVLGVPLLAGFATGLVIAAVRRLVS